MTLRNEIDEILNTELSDSLKLRLVKVLLDADYHLEQVKAVKDNPYKFGSWVPTAQLRQYQDELRASGLHGAVTNIDEIIRLHAAWLPHKPGES